MALYPEDCNFQEPPRMRKSNLSLCVLKAAYKMRTFLEHTVVIVTTP